MSSGIIRSCEPALPYRQGFGPRAQAPGLPTLLSPDPASLMQGQWHRWLVSPRLRSRLPQREPRQLPVQPHDKLRRAHGRVPAGGWTHKGQLQSGGGWGAQGAGLGAQTPPALPNFPGPLLPTLQNGEILPLKTLTYVALGVTLAALLLTFLFLTLLCALRSNQHGIRRNLTAALGLAQLVFLLGINQADLPVRRPSSPSSQPLRLPYESSPPSLSTPVPAAAPDRTQPWPGPRFPLL